ncbi:hypothetical protein SAMN05216258_107303 [Albimonas pacifica]|uniref:Uncharacterized protein n=1 Tax=Albimonas pacifica TaxID=1114924 RepID=A0A1I3J0G6_9RHOB|nr:hypothetical protein SAMN05216258_107303 [Albimonas pacifica]
MGTGWPHLDDPAWRGTCPAPRLTLRISADCRFADAPWRVRTSNTTVFVTASGLASTPIPDGPGAEAPPGGRGRGAGAAGGDDLRASADPGPDRVARFRADLVRLVAEFAGRPTFDEAPDAGPAPGPLGDVPRDRPATSREDARAAADGRASPGEFGPVDPFRDALDPAACPPSAPTAGAAPADDAAAREDLPASVCWRLVLEGVEAEMTCSRGDGRRAGPLPPCPFARAMSARRP